MRSFLFRVLAVGWAGLLGFVILIVGAGIWSALVGVNLNVSPGIPWAVPAMSVVLALLWLWLAGKGWPRSTAEARRDCLRANLVSKKVLGWSTLAGTLAVVALAGFWIVMVQLVRMPGNALPDFSRYPLWTVVAMILMGSAAAPLTEEPAFRGYCQVILERNLSAPVAICVSSMLFALGHGPTQGFLWPKLRSLFSCGAGVRHYSVADELNLAGDSESLPRPGDLLLHDLASGCGAGHDRGDGCSAMVLDSRSPGDRFRGTCDLVLSETGGRLRTEGSDARTRLISRKESQIVKRPGLPRRRRLVSL